MFGPIRISTTTTEDEPPRRQAKKIRERLTGGLWVADSDKPSEPRAGRECKTNLKNKLTATNRPSGGQAGRQDKEWAFVVLITQYGEDGT